MSAPKKLLALTELEVGYLLALTIDRRAEVPVAPFEANLMDKLRGLAQAFADEQNNEAAEVPVSLPHPVAHFMEPEWLRPLCGKMVLGDSITSSPKDASCGECAGLILAGKHLR